MKEYTGVIHVHSTYSDGSADVPAILAAARATGLDFVLLTDHDTAAARREGWEGRHDGVTVMVGVEITPWRDAHCLALGIESCPGFGRMPAVEYLDRIGAAGGFALVPHPEGKQKQSLGVVQRPWSEWRHPAVTGMEIWSYMHDWIDTLHAGKLVEFYQFWRHPHTKLRGPNPALLRLWDRLGRERKYVGVPGIDCHGRRLPLSEVVIFPYEQMFRTLRLHVLLADDAAPEPSELLAAVRAGRAFVSHDFFVDARGLRFDGECGCGRPLQMGDEHCCGGAATLRLHSTMAADLTLLCNGRTVAAAAGREIEFRAVEPGVYRAEARLDGRPWAFTNPIYLRAAARR